MCLIKIYLILQNDKQTQAIVEFNKERPVL